MYLPTLDEYVSVSRKLQRINIIRSHLSMLLIVLSCDTTITARATIRSSPLTFCLLPRLHRSRPNWLQFFFLSSFSFSSPFFTFFILFYFFFACFPSSYGSLSIFSNTRLCDARTSPETLFSSCNVFFFLSSVHSMAALLFTVLALM